MLNMDKDAIKELMEMEAVPVCDRLGSLLGRSVKMAVSKVEETDMGSLAEGLPHFNVAIESRKAVGACRGPAVHLCQGGHDKAYQLYHGCAGGCPEPLDEIASAL